MSVLNIGSRSDDWRAQRLSNFSADAFVLDGVSLASVEGFIQGIKFRIGNPLRQQAFALVGVDAKRISKHAEGRFVWWQGPVLYGWPSHHSVIERAIRAKFHQNEEAKNALLATQGLTITHDLGKPESSHTSLPATVFCRILTRIRAEAFQTL